MTKISVLTKAKHFDFIRLVLPEAKLTETLDDLDGGSCLLTFITGVIVPHSILESYARKYNFHPASSAFPGRDPHHWACYNAATEFGAVAHVMTALVDDGAIVGALTVGAPNNSTPADYHKIGDTAVNALFVALAPTMATEEIPAIGIKWGQKRKRADLISLCATISMADEVSANHMRRSFAGFEQHFA